MTDQQARLLLAQIQGDGRVQAEIIRRRGYGEKRRAAILIKLFHKRLKRTLTISETEEWKSVQEAWELCEEEGKPLVC